MFRTWWLYWMISVVEEVRCLGKDVKRLRVSIASMPRMLKTRGPFVWTWFCWLERSQICWPQLRPNHLRIRAILLDLKTIQIFLVQSKFGTAKQSTQLFWFDEFFSENYFFFNFLVKSKCHTTKKHRIVAFSHFLEFCKRCHDCERDKTPFCSATFTFWPKSIEMRQFLRNHVSDVNFGKKSHFLMLWIFWNYSLTM